MRSPAHRRYRRQSQIAMNIHGTQTLNERSPGVLYRTMPWHTYTNKVVAVINVTGASREFQGDTLANILAVIRERAGHLSMKKGYLA